MPHVIIEYSRELAGDREVEAMLDGVHRTVAVSGLFAEGNIKLRALPLDHYLLGGKRAPFVHVQLRLHAGRSSEQKRALSEAVIAVLREQEWQAQVITVEVVEMARDSYAKFSRDDG